MSKISKIKACAEHTVNIDFETDTMSIYSVGNQTYICTKNTEQLLKIDSICLYTMYIEYCDIMTFFIPIIDCVGYIFAINNQGNLDIIKKIKFKCEKVDELTVILNMDIYIKLMFALETLNCISISKQELRAILHMKINTESHTSFSVPINKITSKRVLDNRICCVNTKTKSGDMITVLDLDNIYNNIVKLKYDDKYIEYTTEDGEVITINRT